MKLAFLLKLCLLSSCTTTSYNSTGLINVYAGLKATHKITKSVEGVNKFYIWGMLPSKIIVNIDQKAIRSGLSSFSIQTIEEFQTFKQYFVSFVTFGMYIPYSYKVVGHGIKSGI